MVVLLKKQKPTMSGKIELSIKNLPYFMFNHKSDRLTSKDQKWALFWGIILGGASFGLATAICWCLKGRVKLPSDQPPTKVSNVAWQTFKMGSRTTPAPQEGVPPASKKPKPSQNPNPIATGQAQQQQKPLRTHHYPKPKPRSFINPGTTATSDTTDTTTTSRPSSLSSHTTTTST